jgi:hypothetical protein
MDYPFEEPLLPERIKRELKEMRTLLPDLQAEIQHLVADGANATTVERWSGTSAATGNRVEGTVFHLFRFEDGQVVEERSEGWGWLDALKHSQTALPPMDALARLYTTRIWTFQPGRGGIASLPPLR